MTKRRDPLTPAKVKPLYGAKKPYIPIERPDNGLPPTPERQALLRSMAAGRTSSVTFEVGQ